MAIYGTPALNILDDQTDRIGIRTMVLALIWQPSRWPMSIAEYDAERPAPPAMGGGLEFYGDQTRRYGGALRTTWTFRGISGSGKDVTFKTRGLSLDYKFEPGFAQVSLLLHPRIQDFLASYGGAVVDGEIVWAPTLTSGANSTSGAYGGGDGGKRNPLFGQQDYLRVEGTYTYRYASFDLAGIDAGVGQAHAAGALPGAAKSYPQRDYLKLPAIYRRVGPVYDISETYWLSGEGGWPQPIYGLGSQVGASGGN